MEATSWTVRNLSDALASGSLRPVDLAREALAHSNLNLGHNTYLWQDKAWSLAEAARAEDVPRGEQALFARGRSPLWGLPISVKDCFDLSGAPTSCGVRFYRDLHGQATQDSWLVENLRASGAVITGKTHMHPLAYGITGENPEFGDCMQPGDPGALTGGSSSGAAASVLEGSAVAAIGTDTGGSIRVPAALCRLAGYRASLGRGDWRGAAHLAPSFDTMGWLFRDLEDAPLLASVFAPNAAVTSSRFSCFGVIDERFLHDCEPEIIAGLHAVVAELETIGLRSSTFAATWWADSFEIYAPFQAWEAARIHAGHFDQFEPSIRERLERGARIPEREIDALRVRHERFKARMAELFAQHQLLLMPAAPIVRLAAGADHSQTRGRLLRYTTPFSLAGVPVVALPSVAGGMQLAAAHNDDQRLVQLAATIGARRKLIRA